LGCIPLTPHPTPHPACQPINLWIANENCGGGGCN
jgi:hypothetical protein